MERIKLYQESEWANINEEDESDGFEGENDKKKKCDQESYCVVCNKKFKSDKQWKNHEQSKKHSNKVAELRLTFEEDEEFVEEKPDDGAHASFDYDPQESEESDDFEEVSEKFVDALELSENDEDAGHQEDVVLQENDNEEERAEETNDEASILEAMVTGRRENDYFNHDDSLLNNNPNNVEQSSMDFGSQKRDHKITHRGKKITKKILKLKKGMKLVGKKQKFRTKNQIHF